eukprot:TRINITY_DN6835_c0_g1_i1.p1 TRINITY_DN6835_c0_g1~~TRINITY_DN6835_c0_g1_i1.p1  ORF type:complete len:601 (+),score=120.66 TRINITY_DN6835_c0_g1_i1:30-1832(+)
MSLSIFRTKNLIDFCRYKNNKNLEKVYLYDSLKYYFLAERYGANQLKDEILGYMVTQLDCEGIEFKYHKKLVSCRNEGIDGLEALFDLSHRYVQKLYGEYVKVSDQVEKVPVDVDLAKARFEDVLWKSEVLYAFASLLEGAGEDYVMLLQFKELYFVTLLESEDICVRLEDLKCSPLFERDFHVLEEIIASDLFVEKLRQYVDERSKMLSKLFKLFSGDSAKKKKKLLSSRRKKDSSGKNGSPRKDSSARKNASSKKRKIKIVKLSNAEEGLKYVLMNEHTTIGKKRNTFYLADIKADAVESVDCPVDVFQWTYDSEYIYCVSPGNFWSYSTKLKEWSSYLSESINKEFSVVTGSRQVALISKKCQFIWEDRSLSEPPMQVNLETDQSWPIAGELSVIINAYIIVIGRRNMMEVWNYRNRTLIHCEQAESRFEHFLSIVYKHGNLVLSTLLNIYVFRLDYTGIVSREHITYFSKEDKPISCAYPHSSGILIVASIDGTLYIIEDSEVVSELEIRDQGTSDNLLGLGNEIKSISTNLDQKSVIVAQSSSITICTLEDNCLRLSWSKSFDSSIRGCEITGDNSVLSVVQKSTSSPSILKIET